MARKSSQIVFSFGGLPEPIAKMYLAPTRDDGFCFGYAEKDFPRVHLTVFFKEGKLRSHIKDETEQDKSTEYPWGQQMSIDLAESRLNRIVRRWIERPNPQSSCYVMQPNLSRKLEQIAPTAKDDKTLNIPLEFVFGEIELDFRNRRRWRKMRIAELRKTRPYFGYLISKKGIPKVVMPYGKDEFISFSERQHNRLQRELGKILGFDMFFDYLRLRHGDRIRMIEQRKVSELEDLLQSTDDFSGLNG